MATMTRAEVEASHEKSVAMTTFAVVEESPGGMWL